MHFPQNLLVTVLRSVNMLTISAIFIPVAVFLLWRLATSIAWIIRARRMTKDIPGPGLGALIENLFMFLKIKNQQDIYEAAFFYLKKFKDTTTRISKLWIGPTLLLLIDNPEQIEKILTSPAAQTKCFAYDYMALTGNGVSVKNGEDWRRMRKPLNKILTRKLIESNIRMFHEKSLLFCKVLSKYAASGQQFDVMHYSINYTLDILCVSNFGYDVDELSNDKRQIAERFKSTEFITVYMTAVFPYNLSLQYSKISTLGRRLKENNKELWKLAHELLQNRIKQKKLQEESQAGATVYYSDIVNQIVEKDKLNWEDTAKLLTDFIIDGFDTSGVVIAMALLMLAMHPEHQDAVYQEQLDVLGEDPEIAPTWEDLSKMSYLNRVFKELCRLFAPPMIFRKLTNDIDIGDHKLPKGANACIMLYPLHRNPNFWSHPNEFYPDHFLPEEVAARPKGSFIPFSAGPRTCPGAQYASATTKVLLSTFIRKYRVETDLKYEELKYKYSLMLEIAQPSMIRILPRSNNLS